MATHTFRVQEIHCGACEGAIRKALTRLDGITDVQADAASDQVSVSYDAERTDLAAIAERLDTAGYPIRR